MADSASPTSGSSLSRNRRSVALIAAMVGLLAGGGIYFKLGRTNAESREQAHSIIALADSYERLSERHESLVTQVKAKGDDYLTEVQRNSEAFQKATNRYQTRLKEVEQHNISERLRAAQEYYYQAQIWPDPTAPEPMDNPDVPAFGHERSDLEKLLESARTLKLRVDDVRPCESMRSVHQRLATCIDNLLQTAQANLDIVTEMSHDKSEGAGSEEGEFLSAEKFHQLRVGATRIYDEALVSEVARIRQGDTLPGIIPVAAADRTPTDDGDTESEAPAQRTEADTPTTRVTPPHRSSLPEPTAPAKSAPDDSRQARQLIRGAESRRERSAAMMDYHRGRRTSLERIYGRGAVQLNGAYAAYPYSEHIQAYQELIRKTEEAVQQARGLSLPEGKRNLLVKWLEASGEAFRQIATALTVERDNGYTAAEPLWNEERKGAFRQSADLRKRVYQAFDGE